MPEGPVPDGPASNGAARDGHAPDAGTPFVTLLVSFSRELRAAGVAVGSGDVLGYCAAMAPLDPTDLLDLYWGGRTTLVTRRESIPVYDRVFRRFFQIGRAHV